MFCGLCCSKSSLTWGEGGREEGAWLQGEGDGLHVYSKPKEEFFISDVKNPDCLAADWPHIPQIPRHLFSNVCPASDSPLSQHSFISPWNIFHPCCLSGSKLVSGPSGLSFFLFYILSLDTFLNLPAPLFTDIIPCAFQTWWGDLMGLEWSAEGETRRSNVGERQTIIFSPTCGMKTSTRTARCHQSRSGVSHWGGS